MNTAPTLLFGDGRNNFHEQTEASMLTITTRGDGVRGLIVELNSKNKKEAIFELIIGSVIVAYAFQLALRGVSEINYLLVVLLGTTVWLRASYIYSFGPSKRSKRYQKTQKPSEQWLKGLEIIGGIGKIRPVVVFSDEPDVAKSVNQYIQRNNLTKSEIETIELLVLEGYNGILEQLIAVVKSFR